MFNILLQHFLSVFVILLAGLIFAVLGLISLVKSIKENKKCDVVKGVITYVEVKYKMEEEI